MLMFSLKTNYILCPHLSRFCKCLLRCTSNFVDSNQKPMFNVKEHLQKKIIATGPISVAEFMRATLTSPNAGYYMKQDMLGADGDFITSPELSQMFGELIGVWLLSEWLAHGASTDVGIVELGPGRGTLADDVMRTFGQLERAWKGTTPAFHLVEVSPTLAAIQQELLCQHPPVGNDDGPTSSCGKRGFPISWHSSLDSVPSARCMLFVAHEFFDALPVHKFVRDGGEWKEVYVDVVGGDFRFTLMSVPTLACRTLIRAGERRSHIEVSPEAAVICGGIAAMISNSCGSSLIADYGGYGTTEDTLRAFKQHSQVDVLHDVGHCDITADVDFKYLHDNFDRSLVTCSGPITQRTFLQSMGIDARLMMLLRHTDDDDVRRKLIGSYDVMTNPDKMGERFKFFAASSRDRADGAHHVTGFPSQEAAQSAT